MYHANQCKNSFGNLWCPTSDADSSFAEGRGIWQSDVGKGWRFLTTPETMDLVMKGCPDNKILLDKCNKYSFPSSIIIELMFHIYFEKINIFLLTNRSITNYVLKKVYKGTCDISYILQLWFYAWFVNLILTSISVF